MLATARKRIAKRTPATLTAIINPTGDLSGTEKEGKVVASHFPAADGPGAGGDHSRRRVCCASGDELPSLKAQWRGIKEVAPATGHVNGSSRLTGGAPFFASIDVDSHEFISECLCGKGSLVALSFGITMHV